MEQLKELSKEQLDTETFPLVETVDLFYLSDKEKKKMYRISWQGKIKLDAKTAKCIRDMAGNVTEKSDGNVGRWEREESYCREEHLVVIGTLAHNLSNRRLRRNIIFTSGERNSAANDA